MKAWVLHNINDIRLEEKETPCPKAGEVLVRVKTCGICGSDIPRVYENGAHNMPLVPGHEFSGMVEGIGEGVDSSWIGKRVGIFPMIPCEKCKSCLGEHYELCVNYDYLGSRRDGGFAEFVLVPEKNLIEVTESISFEEAAMLEPMAVAVHAMRIGIGDAGRMSKDSVVAICGLGTIGMLLMLFLLEAGYSNLYVIGNKDFQRELVQKTGLPADKYIDSRFVDAAKFLQEKGGADLFFECVGRKECFAIGIDGSAPMGRIVTVGNPYGDVELSRDTYWKILRRQLTILGTWNSSFKLGCGLNDKCTINVTLSDGEIDDWRYVLVHVDRLVMRPEQLITHRYQLEELRSGLELMRDKKEAYCKVMVTI